MRVVSCDLWLAELRWFVESQQQPTKFERVLLFWSLFFFLFWQADVCNWGTLSPLPHITHLILKYQNNLGNYCRILEVILRQRTLAGVDSERAPDRQLEREKKGDLCFAALMNIETCLCALFFFRGACTSAVKERLLVSLFSPVFTAHWEADRAPQKQISLAEQ